MQRFISPMVKTRELRISPRPATTRLRMVTTIRIVRYVTMVKSYIGGVQPLRHSTIEIRSIKFNNDESNCRGIAGIRGERFTYARRQQFPQPTQNRPSRDHEVLGVE